MPKFGRVMCLGLLAAIGLSGAAHAQYYQPPPGYYPPPPRYEPGPPRYYRGDFGERCEAFNRTPFGPRRLICNIVEAKPLGAGCVCPPPPPPPGYPEGPYQRGRVVP